MELALHDTKGSVEVGETTYGVDFNEALIHQVVTAYLAGARSGTRAQKSRAAVSGGGSKPWRQKGTGRARAGTSRSPIWRGGGKTFAAVPADHSQKVNRKMYRAALRSILSELVRQDRLVAVDSFTLEAPKTKQLVSKLADLGVREALVVVDQLDDNLILASRNLYDVDVRDVDDLDPVSLVGYEKVVVTATVLKKLEERLQ